MPYLRIQTNRALTKAEADDLAVDASKLAAKLLGKAEEWVMVAVEPGVAMRFAGIAAPLAYVELKSIGLPREQATGLVRALCDFVGKELDLPAARVYVELTPVDAGLWGWNGETFD